MDWHRIAAGMVHDGVVGGSLVGFALSIVWGVASGGSFFGFVLMFGILGGFFVGLIAGLVSGLVVRLTAHIAGWKRTLAVGLSGAATAGLLGFVVIAAPVGAPRALLVGAIIAGVAAIVLSLCALRRLRSLQIAAAE